MIGRDDWGVADGWWDTDGRWHDVDPDTRTALRRAQGADDHPGGPPGDTPIWFTRPGEQHELWSPAVVATDAGETIEVSDRLPHDLPLGAHELRPLDGGPVTRLFVVPPRAPRPARGWGWSTQLYASRSHSSWGHGDLVDLAALASWSQGNGAELLAHNPLGASLPLAHQQPSPYYASSRRFWSPLYLRVESVIGADLIGDELTDAAAAGVALNVGPVIDRDQVWALKLAALERIWTQVRHRRVVLDTLTIAADDEGLTRHATFCALAEVHGTGWLDWPAEHRHPETPSVLAFRDTHADRVAFWTWLHIESEVQLSSAAAAGAGLMADLPVGFDPSGSDAWADQDLLALDCSVGAPPDDFSPTGQDWGLPPYVPWKLRNAGYTPWIDTLRRIFRHCSALRVDHVMGLFRLFWIPSGLEQAGLEQDGAGHAGGAAHGGYVYQYGTELLDLAVMEAVRAGATLVGEDLGTVEDDVRGALSERDVFGYRIGWFQDDDPAHWPATTLASLTTHDLPTVAGLWTGEDAHQRELAGLAADPEGDGLLHGRLARLIGPGDGAPAPDDTPEDRVVLLAHRALADSGSDLAVATLEDAVGVGQRPNLPGTIDEHPNWRRALPVAIEDLDRTLAPVVAEIMCTARGRSDPAQQGSATPDPEIRIPSILVTTFYRGLSPAEMEGAITLRMEQRFVEASYVEHIESQSLAGISYIKVFFQPEYSIDAAQSELTSLAYSIIRLLPPGVFPPSVYKFGVASLPVGFLSISSDNLGAKEIRDLAYFNLRQQIANIPGISFGPPLGGKVRQITVFLDQSRMLARGISPSEIVKAINAQSAIIPAGDIKIGDLDYYVYSNSLVDVVEKINDLPIKIINGTPVLVRDIGTASDSSAIQTSIVRVNGREATYLPITRQEGANTLEVTDGIRAKLQRLTEIPAGTSVKFIYDQSLYIRQAIANLQKEGLLGAGLAGLMIFVFLRSIKAALVVGLAIPLSLTAALVALYLSGQSVNIMTLGGLALVIGTLLDNNIVVQENLHRHLEMGKDGRSAAEDSATELTLPILVATICILIVYLPIMFFSGIIKYLFVPLAMTVAFAMLADYAVSMSVTPVILARLYEAGHGGSPDEEGSARGGWFRYVLAAYEPLLRAAVRFKLLVIAVAVLALLGTGALLLPRLPTEFFPRIDAGNFTMLVTAPEGSRIEKTTAIVGQIEHLIQETIPKQELEEVISNTGLYYGDAARFAPNTGNHTAFVLVNLVTGHEGHTEDYITALRSRLRKDLPGVEVAFQTGGIISDVLNFGLRAPIDIQVRGPHLDLIRPVAEEIQQRVAQVRNTADVRIKQGKSYPELHIDVDRTKAAYYGITQDRVIVDVITGISSNLALSPNYWLDPKTANGYYLLAQYPEQSLTKTEDLLNIPIIGARTSLPPTASLTTTGTGGSILALQNTPFAGRQLDMSNGFYGSGDERRGPPVLLRDVASLKFKTGPDSVDHYDLSRLIDVLVTPLGNDLGKVAREIEQVLAQIELPKDVRIQLRGEVANMRDAIDNFALALPLAVLLIYLVMIGLFRSLIDPLIILVAVPLGWIGTVLLLHVTNTSVNVESMIGTLMMMGIVVSNSILLVDFANRMVRAGATAETAVMEAGKNRIRPIMMTALATILGLLPLALGFGEGNETMVPLARAVVGGLAVSTVMTLLVVPVLHSLVLSRRVHVHHSPTPSAAAEEI